MRETSPFKLFVLYLILNRAALILLLNIILIKQDYLIVEGEVNTLIFFNLVENRYRTLI